jgi:hypothetical protein
VIGDDDVGGAGPQRGFEVRAPHDALQRELEAGPPQLALDQLAVGRHVLEIQHVDRHARGSGA